MPDPPSKPLQKVLFGQKLCTPRDVRRCSSRVRRLSRDLPTFDSVWLDALVQSRVLTAFQAQAIEAGEADRLSIGPCLTLDRLGHSSRAETFLARHCTTREPYTIKQVSLSIELAAPTLDRLNSLVENGQSIEHPGLVLPQAVSQEATTESRATKTGFVGKPMNQSGLPAAPMTRINIVSKYCEALSLSQLILRRGRLPASTVLNIARQMLDSLAVLHDRNVIHGDVSLRNALLVRNGQVVLVDCGIRAAVQPDFHIDPGETPERYDGIAPELIGTGNAASISSDLYALGCLLWHLLAGRSAFPTGDPLARLAAHQTERIPDIREIAPETPDSLAEAVLWLTEPNPRRRLGNARSALVASKCASAAGRSRSEVETGRSHTAPDSRQSGSAASSTTLIGENDVRIRPKTSKAEPPPRATLGQPRAGGRRGLSTFAQSFQHPALQTSRTRRSLPFVKSFAAAVAAVLLAGVALFCIEPDSRRFLLAAFPASGAMTDGVQSESTPERPSAPQALPEPDHFGRIDLPSAGPWKVDSITWTGRSLTIRSTGDQPAQLLVDATPLQIRAPIIILDGIELVQTDADSTLTAMALLQCQELTIRGCTFTSPETTLPVAAAATATADRGTARYAIGWQPLDSTDRLAGQVTIQNSLFAGDWSTVWLDETSKSVTVENTLKKGSGPFFTIEQPARHGETRSFLMKNVTLRESGPVVVARLTRNWLWETQLTMTLHDCVIDLARRDETRRPLFAFEGETLPRNWQTTLGIDGSGSFVRPDTTLVGIEQGPRFATLPSTEVDVRGLSSANFTFRAANAGLSPEESVIDEIYANRRTADPPGIRTLNGRLQAQDATVDVEGQR